MILTSTLKSEHFFGNVFKMATNRTHGKQERKKEKKKQRKRKKKKRRRLEITTC
jgi:hypothetical protein